jgi:pimeloyl-ACP methyl ester carboxylesterase
MDAPPIRYARTDDGVNIAYWTLGEGPPIVLSQLTGTAGSEWEIPQFRSLYEGLGHERQLIGFDGRGSGSSDLMPEDISLRARASDIEAVADELQLNRHDLIADFHGCPPSIVYAAEHPDRVAHLVLWQPYARYADYRATHGLIGLRQISDTAMDTWAMALAQRLSGFEGGAAARSLAKIIESAYSKEALDRFYEAIKDIDLSETLGQVEAPTLVMHRRYGHFSNQESSRFVAAVIPNARSLVLAGDASLMAFGDQAEVINRIREFTDEHAGADDSRRSESA